MWRSGEPGVGLVLLADQRVVFEVLQLGVVEELLLLREQIDAHGILGESFELNLLYQLDVLFIARGRLRLFDQGVDALVEQADVVELVEGVR